MIDNEPKVLWGEGTPWKTKAAFYVYLRGCLRKAWMRHPNKIRAINASRYKAPKLDKDGNPVLDAKGNEKLVWKCTCGLCGYEGPIKEFQVDHIEAAGKLNCFEDIPGFVARLLFVLPEDLRNICKTCNSILSYCDRTGLSFEEAKAEKEAIALAKSKKDKKWLQDHGVKPESSISKRREQIVKILLAEKS